MKGLALDQGKGTFGQTRNTVAGVQALLLVEVLCLVERPISPHASLLPLLFLALSSFRVFSLPPSPPALLQAVCAVLASALFFCVSLASLFGAAAPLVP